MHHIYKFSCYSCHIYSVLYVVQKLLREENAVQHRNGKQFERMDPKNLYQTIGNQEGRQNQT